MEPLYSNLYAILGKYIGIYINSRAEASSMAIITSCKKLIMLCADRHQQYYLGNRRSTWRFLASCIKRRGTSVSELQATPPFQSTAAPASWPTQRQSAAGSQWETGERVRGIGSRPPCSVSECSACPTWSGPLGTHCLDGKRWPSRTQP